METFRSFWASLDREQREKDCAAMTADDVCHALNAEELTPRDFLALLSPAMPLQAAEGLPATPQAAVDALSLERDIHTLMRDKKALAGVALLTEDGLCAGVHMDAPFPLLSVIKFPLAVAVLEKMQHEQATLTTMIPVRAEQLHTGTHSPLRDQRGRRDMEVSLEDLLRMIFPLVVLGSSSRNTTIRGYL